MAVPLKIASYNIQKAIGADLRRRPERILKVLDEIGADVIVLQEADRRIGERRTTLPSDLLSQHGWAPVPFDTRPASIGWHGNAVLCGPRVKCGAHQVLVIPYLEPRGAVLADLEVDGAPFRVAGMHLDLSGLMRRRQAKAIIAAVVDAKPHMPSILMGDLNEWRPAAGCIADFCVHHHIVQTGHSYPAPRPMASLDRIFLSDDLHESDAGVHRSALASIASDHLPAWVQVNIPRPR